MDSELMTVGEVTKALNGEVTPATVRAWADRGLLRVERTRSGMRLFRRSDVEQLARERKARAQVPQSAGRTQHSR